MVQDSPRRDRTPGAETGATWEHRHGRSRAVPAPYTHAVSADVPPPVTPAATPSVTPPAIGPGTARPTGALPPVATAPRPVRLPVRRIRIRRAAPGSGWLLASRIVLGAALAVTLMIAALAAGSRLDDRRIDQHLGTATATVLSLSALHTGIEFVDGGGVTIRPPDGVLYPGLLSVGQKFKIEYSTLDPTIVRVAGRTAAVGNLILLITLGVTWLVALGANLVLRRRWRAIASRAAIRPDPLRLGSTP